MKRIGNYSEVHSNVSRILDQIELSEEPIVVMSVGIPISGKSIILDGLARSINPGIRPVSVDSINNRLRELHAKESFEILLNNEIEKEVKASLIKHDIAFVDHTYINALERQVDIRRFRGLGKLLEMGEMTVGAVFMNTDTAVVLERNEQRSAPMIERQIHEMADQLEANQPAFNDGFDWIATVDGVDVSIAVSEATQSTE